MVDAQPSFYVGREPTTPRSAHEAGSVETPHGPPLARVVTDVAGVALAQYSNVDVIEIDVGGHTVMRRVSDDSMNATQILKLAGLDRSRRQKALDRDVGVRFEKIQGGTGKYQGTWIPFNKARSLAIQYSVHDRLAPLFDFDLSQRPQFKLPSPGEVERRRLEMARELQSQPASSSPLRMNQSEEGSSDAAPKSTGAEGSDGSGFIGTRADRQDSLQTHASNGIASEKGQNEVSGESTDPNNDRETGDESKGAISMHDDDLELETLPPLEPVGELADVSRDIVTELFLSANRGEPRPLTDILGEHHVTHVEVDVPIDDAGHTALHWAAALGRISLVSDLVQHGANCRRGNRKGESPLVRAVLVTNNSDNQTFTELLDLIFPSLHLGDAHGRTVLHHISLTAGIPGRSDASRYYLEALLEWAVKRRGAGGVAWLVEELVDVQDANGDTALNIAARLGSRRIAQQLVDVGASVDLPNRAGLRPIDFGVLAQQAPRSATPSLTSARASQFGTVQSRPASRAGSVGPGENSNGHSRSGSRAPMDGAERRGELMRRAVDAVAQLDAKLQRELNGKDNVLRDAHAKLKETSDQLEALEDRRKQLSELRDQRAGMKARLASLDKAISTEDSRFHSENAHQFAQVDADVSFDADQPFRVDPKDDLTRLPPVLLQARIKAYRQNEQMLEELRSDLLTASLDGEAKFRKVVAQCTSSDEDKVDTILEDLLTAVAKGSGDAKDSKKHAGDESRMGVDAQA